MLERYAEFAPAGVPGRPYTPDHLLEGGETIEVAGISFECVCDPGPLAGAPRLLRRRRASSAATCSSPARSAASTCRAPTGTRCSTSIRMLADRYPPETIVYPGHGPQTTLGAELAAQSVPRGAARVTRIEAPRGTHDILPSEQPLWQKVTGEMERLCALYGYRRIQTPVFEDTELFQRTSGRRLRHRAEGDVHLRGPRRPLADAAPGRHGADLPRVPRARHAPRAAAA